MNTITRSTPWSLAVVFVGGWLAGTVLALASIGILAQLGLGDGDLGPPTLLVEALLIAAGPLGLAVVLACRADARSPQREDAAPIAETAVWTVLAALLVAAGAWLLAGGRRRARLAAKRAPAPARGT